MVTKKMTMWNNCICRSSKSLLTERDSVISQRRNDADVRQKKKFQVLKGYSKKKHKKTTVARAVPHAPSISISFIYTAKMKVTTLILKGYKLLKHTKLQGWQNTNFSLLKMAQLQRLTYCIKWLLNLKIC